jgi:pimeloyl-ACP methyl ester carboxylesterase
VALATQHPERVRALALIGPALPVTPPTPERMAMEDRFHLAYPEDVEGWGKYNLAYWHDHYEDFVAFFFGQLFSEAHSTKPREDAVSWAIETGPDVLAAARLTGGTLLSMAGSGHMPNVRDPVKVNLALRDFIERVGR